MSKGIKLSKEHGINPTIPVCLFCGEDKNEIVMLGATYKGQAPIRMIIDAEPCDKCQENFAKGLTVFEVYKTQQPNTIKIPSGYYVTGRYIVVSNESEFAKSIREQYGNTDRLLMSHDAFEDAFGSLLEGDE